MVEKQGDLWTQSVDAICITTNGFVRGNGMAVMGAGLAKQAAQRYPGIEFTLGYQIHQGGNHVYVLTQNASDGIRLKYTTITLGGQGVLVPYHLVAFPTKPRSEITLPDLSNIIAYKRGEFAPGTVAPGFWCVSPLSLILQSAQELVYLADRAGWTSVALPRPGCGRGERTWDEVRPLLDPILDARFIVMNW